MIEWIVSSSALVAVVILLRTLLKGKIGLRLQYALWGLVLLRLLVPVSFGSTAFSVANALPAEVKTVPRNVMIRGQAEIRTEQGSYSFTLPAQREQYEEKRQELEHTGELVAVVAQSHQVGFRQILTGLWIAGMAVVALCLLGSNLRFALRLRKTQKLLRQDDLPIYLTDEADTPCLLGLFRPAIYITPEAAEEERRLRHVIQHELTHYRHGDQFWGLLRGCCLILHWYNPLVWWAAVLSRQDGELACDEATVHRLGEGERAAYGRTLIHMTCSRRQSVLLTATTMTGSGGCLRERIRLIVKKPKTAVVPLLAVLLATAVAVGCTFTGAMTPPADAPASELPETFASSPEEPFPAPTQPTAIDSITLNLSDFTLIEQGEQYMLRAAVTPEGAKGTIRWSSDDPAVATVDESGIVTAVANGWTVIRASAGGVSSECIVRVNATIPAGEGIVETEAVTATLHFYGEPSLEGTPAENMRTIYIDAEKPGGAELIDELKAFIDKFRYWTNDHMVDRAPFYFDGDIEFSDRESVYHFSYEQRELYYDHFFVQISEKDVEYLRGLGE